MHIAIVGAGVSGLVSARVLRAMGLEVTVYEARADVGGVWGPDRRYPGLSTQDSKRTYAFSDHPMAADVPEYPTGRDVHDYLLSYAAKHDLGECIELETKVESATPLPGGQGWTLVVSGPEGRRTTTADWLVMSNGMYSSPHVPDLPGREEFEAAGGTVLAPSQITDPETFRDADVVVLGWGKSAADLAVAALGKARSVSVVARKIQWKLPYRIGRITFEQLMLTRLGELVLWLPRRRRFLGTLIVRLLPPLRERVLRRLERTIVQEWDLERRDLAPTMSLAEFTHMVTPGFFEAIDEGDIVVHREQRVVALTVTDGVRRATLADGQEIPADVVVAATGFDQDLSLLSEDARTELLDEDGDLVLYRHVSPITFPRLAFVGWSNSFRTPLTVEVEAIWTAAYILGLARLPSERERRRRGVTYRLQHSRVDARQVPQVTHGASMPDLDSWIHEAGLSIPLRVRLWQFVRPVEPATYSDLLPQLQARAATAASTGGSERPREMRPRSERARSRAAAGMGEDSTVR